MPQGASLIADIRYLTLKDEIHLVRAGITTPRQRWRHVLFRNSQE
jgi:hypothetical protein